MNIDDVAKILVVFISTLPATLAALAALIASLRNYRRIEENTKLTAATEKTSSASAKTMGEMHNQINGRMADLIEQSKRAAYREGLLHAQPVAAQMAANTESIRANTERIERHAKQNAQQVQELKDLITKLLAEQAKEKRNPS